MFVVCSLCNMQEINQSKNLNTKDLKKTRLRKSLLRIAVIHMQNTYNKHKRDGGLKNTNCTHMATGQQEQKTTNDHTKTLMFSLQEQIMGECGI